MRCVSFFCGAVAVAAGMLRGAPQSWRYSAVNQSLFLDQEKILVRGITWRGLDTEIMAPLGLWRHSIEFYLDTLRAHGVNTVRIPLDENWVLHGTGVPAFPCQVIQEPTNGSSLDLLDALMDKTRRKQMYVVLSMRAAGETAWETVIGRYSAHKNLLGIEASDTEGLRRRYAPCPWLFFDRGSLIMPEVQPTRELVNTLYDKWDRAFGDRAVNTTVVPCVTGGTGMFLRYLFSYLKDHGIENVILLRVDSDPVTGVFDGDEWTNLRQDIPQL